MRPPDPAFALRERFRRERRRRGPGPDRANLTHRAHKKGTRWPGMVFTTGWPCGHPPLLPRAPAALQHPQDLRRPQEHRRTRHCSAALVFRRTRGAYSFRRSRHLDESGWTPGRGHHRSGAPPDLPAQVHETLCASGHPVGPWNPGELLWQHVACMGDRRRKIVHYALQGAPFTT